MGEQRQNWKAVAKRSQKKHVDDPATIGDIWVMLRGFERDLIRDGRLPAKEKREEFDEPPPPPRVPPVVPLHPAARDALRPPPLIVATDAPPPVPAPRKIEIVR